jgi:N-methylhydantoinase A
VRIGIDAGGTFTDFVILHDDGRLEVFKLRSTSSDPASVILQGIQRASPPASTEIVHGSTVATNALLERKGARTAFVTSPGFRDLLELRTCVAWDIENVIFRVNDKGNKQISK